MSGDAQPTTPLPPMEWAVQPERRRRRAWPWLVGLVVVAGLAVAAWFVGEWVARDLVTRTIQEQVVSRLALPPDQEIDVQVAGAVLPQLIAGTLDDVTVSSQDVTLGDRFTGDVTLHAEGVPVRGDAPIRSASARAVLDEAQLRELLGAIDGFPADTIGLAEPDVTASIDIPFFGATFPVGVALTPSASDGDVVLEPASLTLGGAKLDAAQLRDRFGGLADGVLRDWTVCIAQYVPAGLHLADISVRSDTVVADFAVDGRIATDPALQENGTCG